MPRAVVADETFHTTEFTEFFKFQGRRTPWPNRAEQQLDYLVQKTMVNHVQDPS